MALNLRNKRDDLPELDRALEAWRARNSSENGDNPTETLSGDARSRILRGIRDDVRSRRTPFADLFLPARRLALAGVVPALALAAALGLLVQPAMQGSGLEAGQGRLEATKIGGEVVFVLANGDRSHNVYRSTDPKGFGVEPAFVTEDGSFSDSLSSGPDLVFYRID